MKKYNALLVIASLLFALPLHATAYSTGVQYEELVDGDDYNDNDIFMDYNFDDEDDNDDDYDGTYDEEVEDDDVEYDDGDYYVDSEDDDFNYGDESIYTDNNEFMDEGEYEVYSDSIDDDGDFVDNDYDEEADYEGDYDDFEEETQEMMCENQMDMGSCQVKSQMQNAGFKCGWNGDRCMTLLEELDEY
eukprot:CAMPEP_0172510330 /NCGR_PEP_ID=MMETSP1066-20121228/227774_1 /TAXON_ID=671091 /ORGANISM="Coscinodiscus wailesii, Strain CCMP2513" /LENGTH=188 /DNA_ID=CAMNT_0013289239 /DNA_START=163 /DNA_END=729 /DNA_ORIENTATION=-